MAFDFDKLIQKGTEMADAVKSTAVDLAEKGKKQVDLVSEQAKLAKAQRQLGALVYSLAKNGEENQPLVDKYLDAIAEVEAAIETLKAAAEQGEPVDIPAEYEEPAAAEEPAAEEEPIEEEPIRLRGETKTCPVCNAEVDGDACFCNHCGAQL